MLTVMQRSGQRMVQYIQALGLRIVQLCKLAKLWLVNFIHTFPNVVTQYRNQLAQLKLNIEHCLAQFIIQVRLMKVELMIVLLNLGVRGQQLLTTAHKILQRVLALLKRGK
jgi:hypothetical protein